MVMGRNVEFHFTTDEVGDLVDAHIIQPDDP